MKISNFEVIDRCLFWREKKVLVVGDLHLGYEDNLINRGLAVPRSQFRETEEILKSIFKKVGKVRKIILLGDVKHVFGKILNQEFFDFYSLVSLFNKNLLNRGEIIITKGNHDTVLENISMKYKNITLYDYYLLDQVLFLHGDAKSVKRSYQVIEDNKLKLIVLGHFHPAFILRDKKSVKQEKYKCFLYGFSKEYHPQVIFVPSFFPLIEGSDIIKDLEIYEKGMKLVLLDEEGKLYNFSKLNK